ncbi:MAG: DUF3408 domain-containing protein [Dysgonamonadaceae bacterium]|jgi:hypothetical protein|nr:DUF3408 domain-containing protein [Dysgonamonadaceae bacterium]
MKKIKLLGFGNAPQTTPIVETVPITIPKYESVFFKKTGISTRSGKAVYIRKEFHERIMQIVHVIGGEDASLFEYLDNVLAEHFDTHKDEITALYKERCKTDIS